VVEVFPPASFTPGDIDAGLAGTVLRFLPPLAGLAVGRSTFFGDRALSNRPIQPLVDALIALGVRVEYPGSLPMHVVGTGGVPGGPVEVDASASSQFVSGLLLSAPRFDRGLDLRHVGPPVPSRPHIDMTVSMLRNRGVNVWEGPDSWRVEPGPIAALDADIEPDLTNTAAFLAAGMVTGGSVAAAWPEEALQAGDRILEVLEAFGASVTRGVNEVTVGAERLTGADVDLAEVSELTPVAAALAALASGPSRIRGVAHIRGHETDRLAALENELASLGCGVAQTEDGLVIEPAPLRGGVFATYADHRMAHTGAIIGLVVPGVELDDVSCTTKTIDDFPRLWEGLVIP
jgi:3-phosphoshikimate 1-carboxyvinyltransferase